MREDIRGISLVDLKKGFKASGIESYRAGQVFDWIYKKGICDFALMKNLSKDTLQKISKFYCFEDIKTETVLTASDLTQKFLIGLEDHTLIEAASIPQKSRLTACLSTQVGCRFHCQFCASGAVGFRRNLTTAEIIAQFLEIKRHVPEGRITNVVFMGIGEPLDNYDNVLKSIRLLNDPSGAHLGIRKITISTVGLAPAIERLSREGLQIELSISLHAAFDNKRDKLLPINKKYGIDTLLSAVKKYVEATKRKITFEYILLSGYNTTSKDAAELLKLFSGMDVRLNLIPYNRTSEEEKFSPPLKKEIYSFQNYLEKGGLDAIVRKPRGSDIGAACGQLRYNRLKEEEDSRS